MEHGDRRTVTLDDGSEFVVEAIRLPGAGIHTSALVVNDAIRAKSASLLAIAQAMAESRATRLSFFRATRQSLELEAGGPYAAAEDAARESNERVALLFLLAKGRSSGGGLVVTLTDWRDLLLFFKQDLTLGSASSTRG